MNQYDRILKENLLKVLPALLKSTIGLQIDEYEILKDKLQKTIEKEVDFVLKFKYKGEDTVLHIEFQVKNETAFPDRMLFYYVLLWEKYRLPIWQIAYYIGDGDCKLENQVEHQKLKFSYDLIPISNLPYRQFLSSENAETVVMTILANFEEKEAASVVKQIIKRLIEMHPSNQIELKKLAWQLRVSSRLRKLDAIVQQTEETMLPTRKIEEDAYYIIGEQRGELRGEKKGQEKTSFLFVSNMLKKGFPVDVIAEITNLSAEQISKIKQQLDK